MGQAVPENTAEKGPKSEAIPIQRGRPHLSCGARRYLPRFCRRTATEHFCRSTGLQDDRDPQQYRTKLPATLFIKTHRSFILNRTKFKIQPWFNNTLQVILTNGSKVPVSRSYVKEFKKKNLA